MIQVSSCLNSSVTLACWFLRDDQPPDKKLAGYRESVGWAPKVCKLEKVNCLHIHAKKVFKTVEPSTTDYKIEVATEELQY